jgi:lysylphosphatidylglycerol synthetase-like protein (DUF2156 family)
MKCKFCEATNPDNAEYCSVCRRKLDQPTLSSGELFKRKGEFYGRTQPMIPKAKTMVPTAAGGILVINALLAIGGLSIANIYANMLFDHVSDTFTLISFLFGGLAIFVLIGGVLAMMRKRWGITLIACVVSFFLVLIFGLFCAVLEALLSVAALVLLAQARDEFSKKPSEKDSHTG